jgi:hypothetical protein
MFTRVHAIVIPLVLVGLLGFCFLKMQQTTDGVAQALRDTLLAEPGDEQSPLPRMTYQQLRQVMASTIYYRIGFYGGACLLLGYMMLLATRSAPQPEQLAFKPEPATPRPIPSPQAQPQSTQIPPHPRPPQSPQSPPKQMPPLPQPSQATPPPILGTVRLADDVQVEDEEPMLTAELPRPIDIATRSNDT